MLMKTRTDILGLVGRLNLVRPEDVRQDDRIQWQKFTMFADILSVIPDSQAHGPIVTGTASPTFKRHLEDTSIFANEDVSILFILNKDDNALLICS